MENHTIDKEKVLEKLFERYNLKSIGQIEKYPPTYDYFVTLYFKGNFTMSNYYNVNVERELYDFEISNIASVGKKTNVTVKINKQ